MKKINSFLVQSVLAITAALTIFAMVSCTGKNGKNNGNSAVAGKNSRPTIMWLSNLSNGLQYETTVSYLTAICDKLGYNFSVVYGDMANDAAGNLNAVKNGMTSNVKGLIASQDGGILSIMEEYPDLYVCGMNTDMFSVYSGPYAKVLE
ncbi:hypothetical protein, partial [Treponema sp.]|uniref:hypothetical protein n=1 Tax=Treponema sp. TaxID=166 RepID=UPI00298E9668